jgi:hypothetical protein
MNNADLEIRLKRAAEIAASPRSIVEDVMAQIGSTRPDAVSRSRWNHPYIAASIAALGGIAAVVTFVFFLSSATPFTMADVQKAFEEQRWVHQHYDVGQAKDTWTNLQTGECYFTHYSGNAGYINDQTNTRLWYWAGSAVIEQDTPTIYAPGVIPRKWSPHSAWEEFVAPFAHAAATTQPVDSSIVTVKDVLDGVPVIRFDEYSTDMTGKRFLLSQIWADPKTHLPVQEKTRLQLGEREKSGKEWSTGRYDFPTTGPADLYALGVPRDLPIHKQVTTAPTAVQPFIDGINHAHDNFIKNYRAVIWTAVPGTISSIDSLDIIWHQGEKVRDDRHLPGFNAPPTPLTPQALLAWAAQHQPIQIQMIDNEREYSWWSTGLTKGPKPQVQILRHHRFPLLATQEWPESIQWPTLFYGPDFEVLSAGAETPKGCIGLRGGDSGNARMDYFIDPANDFVCMKQIAWTKRGSDWAKTREITLENLHRVNDRVVAGIQRTESFADPVKGYAASTSITTIDLVPVSDTEYPPGTFDPETLKKGATVEGY